MVIAICFGMSSAMGAEFIYFYHDPGCLDMTVWRKIRTYAVEQGQIYR